MTDTTSWLTLDVGNSAPKGGVFAGERLHRTFRLPLDHTASADQWAQALEHALDGAAPQRAGLASVVPDATERARTAIRQTTGVAADVVDPTMRLPFTMGYQTPETLGTDRLAAAAAAWGRYGTGPDGPPQSVIVVDAGTAVTYDVVYRTGVFRGGAIGAGPVLLRQALCQGTAQLPEVPLDLPASSIGASTRDAVQSGLMYGFVDSVQGMMNRISATLDDAPLIVASGGWSDFLRQHVPAVDHAAPHLVLHGIRLLMELNAPRRPANPNGV